jgi:hypothetical protein
MKKAYHCLKIYAINYDAMYNSLSINGDIAQRQEMSLGKLQLDSTLCGLRLFLSTLTMKAFDKAYGGLENADLQ